MSQNTKPSIFDAMIQHAHYVSRSPVFPPERSVPEAVSQLLPGKKKKRKKKVNFRLDIAIQRLNSGSFRRGKSTE